MISGKITSAIVTGMISATRLRASARWRGQQPIVANLGSKDYLSAGLSIK